MVYVLLKFINLIGANFKCITAFEVHYFTLKELHFIHEPSKFEFVEGRLLFKL